MYVSFKGTTRIVIFAGTVVIKIARLRILRFFARAILFPFTSSSNHERLRCKYGRVWWKASLNYICAGLHANRGEWIYFQQTQDCRVVPTIRSYLGGWIVVQLRGQHIPEDALKGNNPLAGVIFDRKCLEVDRAFQFCRLGGRIVLCDYGPQETRDALRETYLLYGR